MNKMILPVASIAIISVIGIALFFNNNQSTPVTPPSNNVEEITNDNSTTGTLLSLMKLGKSYMCTFDTTDDVGNNTKGTVYVAASGNKFNGDFNMTTADGASTDGKVIRDGAYNYIWTSLQEQGFKTKIEEGDDSLFGSDKSSETGLNDEEEFEFDCKPWAVDNSKFVPPSDIEFVDISSQLEQLEEAASSFTVPGGDSCASCDLVPADFKDACLEGLGCN